MKVVVVGASGNIGTALLRALASEPSVTSVAGVARRVPTSTPPPPYDVATWHGVDLSEAGPDEPVVDRLAGVLEGADVVVLLAWALQPSHDRQVRRRTNVVGTRRVLAAVARTGVPHVVATTSVGSYSPVDDDVPRAEDWATDGVRSSDYSVDKVAVERLLDEAETLQPDLRVARVRPALVFQRAAASGIERYFLGPLLPAAALRVPLPVLPWPRGVRLQAVHADDLAQVFMAIIAGGHAGAFNVAAPDVLHVRDLAAIVSQGRFVEVPQPLARAVLHAGWLVHGFAPEPGWVDLAAGIPLLDTGRAESVLGWKPRWSALEAFADLADGLAHGAGTASPPMRPRARARRSLVGGQADAR